MTTSAPEWMQQGWDRNYRDDESARVERCESEAGRWFDSATKPQLTAYRERMDYIRAWSGSPRWERDRDAAVATFKTDTAAARALYDRTLAELLNDGEVSETLADEWAALETAQNAPRMIVVGDHQPERSAA